MLHKLSKRCSKHITNKLLHNSNKYNKSLLSCVNSAFNQHKQCITHFTTHTIQVNKSTNILSHHDDFVVRHIGVTDNNDIQHMLKTCNVNSIDELVDNIVPKQIRLNNTLDLPPALGEYDALNELKSIMSQNHVYDTYIGQGYYNTITPPVIVRNIIENPAWYTPYTPYQAEISQGRLEMLLNYQTMVSDLTGLPVSNCSLLDEGTAAAEAMNMCYNNTNKKKKYFIVSDNVFKQTIDILHTRAAGYGAEIKVVSENKIIDELHSNDVFGVLVQYPCSSGELIDYKELTAQVKQHGAMMCVASDLLALTVIQPPGEYGVDIVLGNSQRFGVPLGYGGM